eukprot:4966036-Pleurochrysis_carterae.AAC.1
MGREGGWEAERQMERCSNREGAGRSELWCDEIAFHRKDTSEEGSEGQFSKEEAERVCWEECA